MIDRPCSWSRRPNSSRSEFVALAYPPARHAHAGQRVQFFNYDPDNRGWYVYGMGTAETNRVVPDVHTRLYGFTGASFNDDNAAPPASWNPPGDCCRAAGDPVDFDSGRCRTDRNLGRYLTEK